MERQWEIYQQDSYNTKAGIKPHNTCTSQLASTAGFKCLFPKANTIGNKDFIIY